ncbi:MAG: DUF4403 family protein [Bacteroidia bacterium]|nr:DUF4403 family protein [Bacteroidia bacterium]
MTPLYLHLTLPLGVLSRRIDTLLAPLLYEGKPAPGLQIQVRKTGPVQLRALREGLESRLELQLTLRFTGAAGLLGGLTGMETMQLNGIARMTTALHIREDWTLGASTQAGWEWATAGASVLQGPLLGLAGPALEQQLAAQAQQIDRLIAALPVRDAVRAAWEALCRPIEAQQAPQLWLMLHPQQHAEKTALRAGAQDLHLRLKLTVQPHLDPLPGEAGPAPEPPEAAYAQTLPEQTRTFVTVRLPWDLLAAQLAGQPVETPAGRYTLRRLRLSGGPLSAYALLEAPAHAPLEVFLQGQLACPPSGKRFLLTVSRMELMQGPWWLRLAARLRRKQLQARVQQALQLELDRHTEALAAQVLNQLASIPLESWGTLNIHVGHWHLTRFEGLEDHLALELSLEGAVRIELGIPDAWMHA